MRSIERYRIYSEDEDIEPEGEKRENILGRKREGYTERYRIHSDISTIDTCVYIHY